MRSHQTVPISFSFWDDPQKPIKIQLFKIIKKQSLFVFWLQSASLVLLSYSLNTVVRVRVPFTFSCFRLFVFAFPSPRVAWGLSLLFSMAVFSVFLYRIFNTCICTFLLSLLPYQVCSLSASLVFYFFSIQLGWDTVGLFMLAALPSCPLWGLLPPPSFLKILRKSRRARAENGPFKGCVFEIDK